VIEQLTDMPEGTLGFRASGEVTREQYREALEPPMREAVERGEVRLMFVVAPEFERFRLGALAEDTKTGVELGLGHHSAWRRCALVPDSGGWQHATTLWAWWARGELRFSALRAADEARACVAG